MPRVLNYLNAPNITIWSAIICSCSLPRIFPGGVLYEKLVDGQLIPWTVANDTWVDGSIEGDLPMKHLSHMFHVNHFIVCQFNPHVDVLLSKRKQINDSTGLFGSLCSRLYGKIVFLIVSELHYRLPTLIEYGILPRVCQIILAILSQSYEGDITILPDRITLNDLLHLFSNITTERIQQCIPVSERYTWPKLSNIRNNTKIERKIDEILYKLRCRLLDCHYAGMVSESTVSLLLDRKMA